MSREQCSYTTRPAKNISFLPAAGSLVHPLVHGSLPVNEHTLPFGLMTSFYKNSYFLYEVDMQVTLVCLPVATLQDM